MDTAFSHSGPTRVFATPGTTSSAAQVVDGVAGGKGALRIHNGTNQIVGVSFGAGSAVASLASGNNFIPVPAGGVSVVRVPLGTTHVAVIAAAASTGAVYVTPGFGLN